MTRHGRFGELIGARENRTIDDFRNLHIRIRGIDGGFKHVGGNGIRLARLFVDAHLGDGNAHALVFDLQRDGFARHVDFNDLRFAARHLHHRTLLGAMALEFLIGIGLVAKAAHEATAQARNLLRVQRQILVFRHANRHRIELAAQASAAQLLAAVPETADDARFVAHADLTHVDSNMEFRSERAYEFAEIDALICFEIENRFVAIEKELDGHGMHIELVLLDHFLENGQRLFGLGLKIRPFRGIFGRGLAHHGLQGAFKFRDGVFGNLFQVFVGHAVFKAALGFHDERIAHGKLDSIGIEPQYPRVIGKPDGSDVRHREPLLSRKASTRCSLAEKHYTKWRLRRRSRIPARA